jgi:hypothetical protein
MRYGLIRTGVRIDSMIGVRKISNTIIQRPIFEKYPWDVWDSYARSYRTLRDGSFEVALTQALVVPGYDRLSLWDIRQQALTTHLVSRVSLTTGN